MTTEVKKRAKRRRHVEPGAPPGVLIAHPEAAQPVIHVIAYGPDEFTEAQLDDLGALGQYLGRWPVVWVNVDGLGDVNTISRLGETFGLHRLALEDVLTPHHHPKIEEYDGHLFLIVRMFEPGFVVDTEQLAIFIGKGFVLTLQERPGDCLDPVRKRIRESRGRIRVMGADHLGYSIVDAVVDAYYPYLDEFAERLENLEEAVLKHPKADAISEIHLFKRNLLTLRRTMAPLREAINALLRDDSDILSESTRVHLRDCYDHVVQILDLVENYRELLGGLLEVYLTNISNRMNEVMKYLTLIATLFIPLSFVAGVYGMNFDTTVSPWNLPELGWYWGYPAFLAVVILVVALEIYFFWRKGWLGNPEKGPRSKRKKAGPHPDHSR